MKNVKQEFRLSVRDFLGDKRYGNMRRGVSVDIDLEQQLVELREKGRKIILLGLPEHGNLGDQAITMAERFFIESYTSLPLAISSGDMTKALPLLQRYAGHDDIIMLHGGGNMGEMYDGEELGRCLIIDSMRRNRIIIFPQTMSYGASRYASHLLKHSKRTYARHADLHLIAREETTLQRMRDSYPHNDTLYTPDIVLSLTGYDDANFSERSGILLCMRHDDEKRLRDEDAQSIFELASKRGGDVEWTDTVIETRGALHPDAGQREVLLKFNQFKRSRLVVTDRLHGMIFCAVTGTPCIALNNSNGKVGDSYQWIETLPYIHFASTVEDVRRLLPEVLSDESRPIYPRSLLGDKYQPLIDLLK